MHKLLQEPAWIYNTSIWLLVMLSLLLLLVSHTCGATQCNIGDFLFFLQSHAYQTTFDCRCSHSSHSLIFFLLLQMCVVFFYEIINVAFVNAYAADTLWQSIDHLSYQFQYPLPTLLPYKWMSWKWTNKRTNEQVVRERARERRKYAHTHSNGLYRWNAS